MSGVREKFEAWYSKGHNFLLTRRADIPEAYLDGDIEIRWDCWQASREAALEEAAALVISWANDWRPCECGAEQHKGDKKLFNTECGHAIDCSMYHAINCADAILALKKGS